MDEEINSIQSRIENRLIRLSSWQATVTGMLQDIQSQLEGLSAAFPATSQQHGPTTSPPVSPRTAGDGSISVSRERPDEASPPASTALRGRSSSNSFHYESEMTARRGRSDSLYSCSSAVSAPSARQLPEAIQPPRRQGILKSASEVSLELLCEDIHDMRTAGIELTESFRLEKYDSTVAKKGSSGSESCLLLADDTTDNDRIAPTLPMHWPASLEIRDLHLKDDEDFLDSITVRDGRVDGRKSLLPTRMSVFMTAHSSMSKTLTSDVSEVGGHPYFRYIQEPDSAPHQVFDMLGVMFLFWDLTVIPYALAWDVSFTGFLLGMTWGSLCFWSVDIVASFFTGFYEDGELVRRLPAIRRHYLRTWFLPDASVVLTDWASMLFQTFASSDSSTNSLKMLRLAKMGRLLRIMSLLRVLRVMRTLEAFVERNLSESNRLTLRLASICWCCLWVNHMLTCLWFGVGRTAPTDTGDRWVDRSIHVQDEVVPFLELGLLYQYVTAFHWSLAQTTLGSMEITPRNSAERLLNIACLVVGLFFGSTLISSLSATMVEFRMSTRDRSQKIRCLRRYLVENHIDKRVARIVQRQVAVRLGEKPRLTVKDVPALEILSTSIRHELHLEICQPHLKKHALLRLWLAIDKSWFLRLCNAAVTVGFLRPGDDLFIAGGPASTAYCLISGKLNYTKDPESAPVTARTSKLVESGKWLCEAALWAQWIHVGKMEATAHSQVLAVHSEGFQKVLHGHRIIRTIARDYCRAFHQRIISARPPISKWPDDVVVPFTDYGDLVASMSKEVQVTIGMIALDNWKPGWSQAARRWSQGTPGGIFHMTVGRKESVGAVSKLREEVAEGKSTVVTDGAGETKRVVNVVAMYITNQDGNVLVQLGKWENSQVLPDCQLPARKRERGERTEEAAERLLEAKLAPLAGITEVTSVEREITERDSKEYGLRTTYMRKVFVMRLTGSFAAPICEGLCMENSPSGNADMPGRYGSRSVYFIRYHDKGIFCAWLPHDEFCHLCSPSGEATVQEWLSHVRPPASELHDMVVDFSDHISEGFFQGDVSELEAPSGLIRQSSSSGFSDDAVSL